VPFAIDDAQIDTAEAEIGARLPTSYRDAMKRSNGGEFETEADDWFLHPIFDNSDRKRITRTANHILLETRVAMEWSGFPRDALCIGHNGSGDRLVFLKDGAAVGDQLYAWRHETGETELIATDFADVANR